LNWHPLLLPDSRFPPGYNLSQPRGNFGDLAAVQPAAGIIRKNI